MTKNTFCITRNLGIYVHFTSWSPIWMTFALPSWPSFPSLCFNPGAASQLDLRGCTLVWNIDVLYHVFSLRIVGVDMWRAPSTSMISLFCTNATTSWRNMPKRRSPLLYIVCSPECVVRHVHGSFLAKYGKFRDGVQKRTMLWYFFVSLLKLHIESGKRQNIILATRRCFQNKLTVSTTFNLMNRRTIIAI